MTDLAGVFSQFPGARLTVERGGPPQYDCGRVILRGNPDGLRLLASVLSAMAGAVDIKDDPVSQHGWQLGLSPDDLSWLKTDGSILVLDCDPQPVSPLRG